MFKIHPNQQKLYLEEIENVDKTGPSLRNVAILSAMIEALVYSVARHFLQSNGVTINPQEPDEYRISINVLESNRILSSDELNDIKEFRKYRKFIFHNLFKGISTRADLDEKIKRAFNIGLKIVKKLEKNSPYGL